MRNLGVRQLALRVVLWRPLVCLALLLCQVSVVILTFSPSSSWYLPLMPPRSYRSAPLALVLADLERNGLIPPGTDWATPGLLDRRVTLDLLDLSTHRQVLSRVARAAGVSIEFPRDVHGNIAGPVHVLGEPSSTALRTTARRSPHMGGDDSITATDPREAGAVPEPTNAVIAEANTVPATTGAVTETAG